MKPEQVLNAAWVGGLPSKKDTPMGIQCWINGVEVDSEAFEFEEGVIYTVGSAPGTSWGDLEECGAAAIDISSNSVRVARMRIGGLPAAAVTTEHVGLILAQRYGKPGARVI